MNGMIILIFFHGAWQWYCLFCCYCQLGPSPWYRIPETHLKLKFHPITYFAIVQPFWNFTQSSGQIFHNKWASEMSIMNGLLVDRTWMTMSVRTFCVQIFCLILFIYCSHHGEWQYKECELLKCLSSSATICIVWFCSCPIHPPNCCLSFEKLQPKHFWLFFVHLPLSTRHWPGVKGTLSL